MTHSKRASHKKQWETFEPWTLEEKDQSMKSPDPRSSICWWCKTHFPSGESTTQLDKFPAACDDFKLNIRLKKTQIMCQRTSAVSKLLINSYALDAVPHFASLCCTATTNKSMKIGICRRTGLAATNTFSMFLQGSDSWTTYARQEHRLNTFYMRNLQLHFGHYMDRQGH